MSASALSWLWYNVHYPNLQKTLYTLGRVKVNCFNNITGRPTVVPRARRYGCIISCQHSIINFYNNNSVPRAQRYGCIISCQHTFINYNNDLVPRARRYGCVISCQHTFIIIIWFRGHNVMAVLYLVNTLLLTIIIIWFRGHGVTAVLYLINLKL